MFAGLVAYWRAQLPRPLALFVQRFRLALSISNVERGFDANCPGDFRQRQGRCRRSAARVEDDVCGQALRPDAEANALTRELRLRCSKATGSIACVLGDILIVARLFANTNSAPSRMGSVPTRSRARLRQTNEIDGGMRQGAHEGPSTARNHRYSSAASHVELRTDAQLAITARIPTGRHFEAGSGRATRSATAVRHRPRLVGPPLDSTTGIERGNPSPSTPRITYSLGVPLGGIHALCP